MKTDLPTPDIGHVASATTVKSYSATQIIEWLVNYLAKALKIDQGEINIDAKFDRYSIDSLMLVVMTEDLEQWLGSSIDPTTPFEYSTIRSLAEYLAQQQQN